MAKMKKNNKHIVITVEKLPNKNYQTLLNTVNQAVFNTYAYIFSKAYPLYCSNVINKPNNFFENIKELQQLGLVSIEESRWMQMKSKELDELGD